ncbi:MAG: FtsX-like permease family protein, partial [Gemmatimonadaceae bacterium]
SAHNYLVIGRLAAGTSIERARAEMTSLSQAMARTFGNDTQAVDAEVTPLREFVVGSYRAMLTVVFAASALVLLIACTNLVSAQLARGWSREREIAVRSALGASRGRIARQLSIESVVLVVCGTGMALVFALAMTRALKAFGASLIPRLNEMSFDFRVVAFVIGAAIATVLLVGLYPATRLSRAAADAALRSSRGAATAIRASLWRLLVGFEVALAVVLLVGSALLVRTLHNILTSNSGIDVRGVITAAMMPRGEDAGRLDELSQSLGRVPGVEGVAFTNQLPFAWGSIAAPVRRPSDPVDHDWPAFAGFRLVSPDYFSVLRQPVLRGRSFTRADASGAEPVAIVTPGIAKKLWPGENPIGKKVATNYLDGSETVVGVVAEASSWSMPRGSQNEIFAPIAQHASALQGQLVAVLRTAKDPALVTTLVHAEIRRLLPRSPARMGTIEERVARSADDRRFAMLAITAFGATALLLAAAGIYGVVWYVVTTRTREIGIRLALGATAGRVQREFLGGALGVAAAGAGVGLVASAAASRYLSASLYGVSHLDPAAYLAGATVAMVAALAGAFVPAWRSSHVDPAVPLRMEG